MKFKVLEMISLWRNFLLMNSKIALYGIEVEKFFRGKSVYHFGFFLSTTNIAYRSHIILSIAV